MVEELQVKIGADASDLIRETRKADRAFAALEDSVVKSSEGIAASSTRARDAFGRFVKAAEGGAKSAEGVAASTGRARDAFGRFVAATEEGVEKTKKVESAFTRLAAAAKRGAVNLRAFTNTVGNLAVKGLVAGFSGLTSIVSAATKGLVAFGGALAAIGVGAAVSFARFQTEFAQVRTLVDESQVDVAALEDGVRSLSRRFGVDLTEATRAAYQAISAGQDPARVIEFLDASFKGAAAGAASTAEAVDLFTTVLNAFGSAAGDTAHVADVLFATIKAGKTTASELAASIGQVAPVAASAGVSLEETSAAIATLTASGLNTAEATTSLKAALVGILNPSEEAARAFKEIGVSAESLREVGLADAITRVREAVQSGNAELVQFFPNVRALVGTATLAGEGFAKFQQSLDATTEAAGAATEAFSKVERTTGFAFNALRRTVEDTFRQIGSVLDPFVARGINAFRQFATSARSEIEVLGDTLSARFAPAVEDAFRVLEDSAETSGDLASKALMAVEDGFDAVASGVRSAAPVIAGVVSTFETLGDVIAVVGNALKVGFGVALTSVGVAVTGFLFAAEKLAGVLGLDVASSLREARELAQEFTQGLAQETAVAIGDTVDSFKDLANVANEVDATEKAVGRFSLSIERAGDKVGEFNSEVSETRNLREQAAGADAASGAVHRMGEAADSASERQEDLGEATDKAVRSLTKFDNATTASKTTADLLGQALERARVAAGGTATEIDKTTDAVTRLRDTASSASEATDSLASMAATAGPTFSILNESLEATRQSADAIAVAFMVNVSAVDEFESKAEETASVLDELSTSIRDTDLSVDQVTLSMGLARTSMVDVGEATEGMRQVFREASRELDEVDAALSSVAAQAGATSTAIMLGLDPAVTQLQVSVDTVIPAVTVLTDALGKTKSDAELTREGLVLLSSVLTGEFQAAGDSAAVALNNGTIEASEFRLEIERLVQAQRSAALGLNELLSPVSALGEGFRTLTAIAGEARAALADRLRDGFERFRSTIVGAAGDTGKLIDKIFELGTRQKELSALNDTAVTAYEKLVDSNKRLAEDVSFVARNIGNEFRPQLDALLEAFDRGVIKEGELTEGLQRLKTESKLLVETKIQDYTLTFATGLDDVKDAAKGAATAIEELTKAQEDAIARTAQLKREAERLQAFGFASGRRPGGESVGEITSRLSGLSFGIRTGRSVGRVNVGEGVFADGGPQLQTGRPTVEAGEFVLSQRGLGDLGRVIADLINRGRGETIVNQTNNFNTTSASPDGSGEDAISELAFKLRPALFHVGRLAAAQSPVV